MIEKLLRKAVDKNDNHIPQNFEQLVQKYGLEKTWIYIDKIIDHVNSHEELYEEIDTKVKEVEKETNNTSNIAKEAQSTAEEAKKNSEESKELVEENNSKVADIQESVEIAESASIAAQEASNQANTSAKEAQTAAEEAKILADDSKKIAAAAQEESNKAMANAQSALDETSAAREEVAEAKADISNVREELTQEIESISNEMEADYAKKTDVSTTESNLRTEISQSAVEIQSTAAQTYAKKTELTEVESALRTQITQNSEEIKSTATDITRIDAEVEDAKEKANVAQVSATTAQNAAEEAKENAEAAQTKANEASSAAATAQAAADEAAKNLEIAKENLEEIQSQADATDEQVELAKKAVEEAQAAADKAQSDANAAQTVADIAQATADTAKTSADNAKTAADNAQAAADEAQAGVNELDNRVTKNETAISQKADSVTVTAMQTQIDDITETKTTKEGITIEIDDSAEEPILELEVDGRSTQDGTPTPEAPIEIQSLGDDVNLFDGEFPNVGYYANVSGGLSQQSDRKTTGFIKVNPNTTYSIKEFNGFLLDRINEFTDANNNTFVKSKEILSSNSTFTTSTTTEYIQFTVRTEEEVKVKLQKGEKSTPYSEYGKGTVEIKKTGKNEFDNTSTPVIISNITQETLETGIRLISREGSTGSYQYALFVLKDLTNYVGKTVRMKADWTATGENKGLYIIGLSTADGNTRTQKSSTYNSGETVSFVVPELTDDKKYLMVWLYANGGGNTVAGDYIDYNNLIVTIDDEDMSYVPHFSNNYVIPTTPLRSLPNGVKDTKEQDGTHKRVIDDTFGEISALYTYSNGLKYGVKTNVKGVNTTSKNINVLCDRAKCELTYLENTIYITGNGASIVIFGSADDTVETFNAKFANAKIIYELKEEVIEPLTEEQQALIDSIKTNLYKQYFTSNANMRITYIRNNGLSDMYETKDSASKKYTETEKKIGELNIEAGLIKAEVAKKVNDETLTGAELMLRINDDTSEASIKADKISLEGKKLDFTTDNMSISSDNFNVDEKGNMEASNATFTGGTIKLNSSSKYTTTGEGENAEDTDTLASSVFTIKNKDDDVLGVDVYPDTIKMSNENSSTLLKSTKLNNKLSLIKKHDSYIGKNGTDTSVEGYSSVDLGVSDYGFYTQTERDPNDINNQITVTKYYGGTIFALGYGYESTEGKVPTSLIEAKARYDETVLKIIQENIGETIIKPGEINLNGITFGKSVEWKDLEYTNGFSAGTAEQLQYSVNNGFVTIRGGATGTFTAGDYISINENGLIPEEYRPSQKIRVGACGSGARPCIAEIGTDGRIKLGFNGITGTPSWIAFSVTYPIEHT